MRPCAIPPGTYVEWSILAALALAYAAASIPGLIAAVFYGMMRVTRDTYETTRGALADKRAIIAAQVPPVASVGPPDAPSHLA